MDELNNYEYIDYILEEKIKSNYIDKYNYIRKRIYLLLFKRYRSFYFSYKNIDNIITNINEEYIKRKLIETKDMLDNVKGCSLDDNQRRCVVTKSKNTLVVAGAGSGKSLTILAKIKYLMEEEYYNENEILCISFTNASSKELESSIYKHLGYKIPVYTFHKLSLKLLDRNYHITDDTLLDYIIDEYFDSIINNLKLPKVKIDEYYKKKIKKFILLFKSNIYDIDIFNTYFKKVDKEDKIFLYNVYIINYLYTIELEATDKIDFQDMIVKATNNVHNLDLPYKQIIIDEYQDSSFMRSKLIMEIVKCTNCSVMAVGDDFQSIYAFSGSNLDIFTNFDKYFKKPEIIKITNTYRNSDELVKVAGKFIMRSNNQIKKNLRSNKHYSYPIKIVYYENEQETFRKLLNKLDNVLVLGRNNRDVYYVTDKIDFNYMTVHQSKGLESDRVILIHMDNSISGFPNRIREDKIFDLLHNNKEDIPYEEERRLFYVALTRTKNEIYIMCPKNKESLFVKEILKYKDTVEIIHI